MSTDLDNTVEQPPEDQSPPNCRASRTGNLPRILGIDGGAFGGVSLGVVIHGTPTTTPLPFYLAVGTVIGAIVPCAGWLAGLGLVIGSFSHNQMFPVFFAAIGAVVGVLWSIAAWGLRLVFRGPTVPVAQECVARARRDRLWLAFVSLIISVVWGLVAAFEPVGRADSGNFRQSVFAGVTVGVSMFVGLAISAFMPTSGNRSR